MRKLFVLFVVATAMFASHAASGFDDEFDIILDDGNYWDASFAYQCGLPGAGEDPLCLTGAGQATVASDPDLFYNLCSIAGFQFVGDNCVLRLIFPVINPNNPASAVFYEYTVCEAGNPDPACEDTEPPSNTANPFPMPIGLRGIITSPGIPSVCVVTRNPDTGAILYVDCG